MGLALQRQLFRTNDPNWESVGVSEAEHSSSYCLHGSHETPVPNRLDLQFIR